MTIVTQQIEEQFWKIYATSPIHFNRSTKVKKQHDQCQHKETTSSSKRCQFQSCGKLMRLKKIKAISSHSDSV